VGKRFCPVPVTILPAYAFCPPAIAVQTDATTWALVFMWFCVLALGSFSRFATLSETEWYPVFIGQVSSKPA
jgi:hypothetical protein